MGWIGIFVVVVWNFIAMTALQYAPYVVEMKSMPSGFATSWVVSLVLVLALPAFAFGVYMCLYTAARKKSSLYYCCFFPVYAALVFFFFLQAIGLPDWGGGGLMELIVIAPDDGRSIVPKIFIGISMFCWLGAVAFGVWLALGVRREYQGAGGLAAAGKEATKVGAQAAYDNRDTIKEAAWEHRDTIKQVAVENKDVIIQAAKDNKQLAAEIAVSAARDNPDLAWQAAVAAAQSSAPAAAPAASPAQFTSSAPQTARPAGAAASSADDVIDWSKF